VRAQPRDRLAVELAHARLRHAELVADRAQRVALLVVALDDAREARRQGGDRGGEHAPRLGGDERLVRGQPGPLARRGRLGHLVEARRAAQVGVGERLVVRRQGEPGLGGDLVVVRAAPEAGLGVLARALDAAHARAQAAAQRVGGAHLVEHPPLDAPRGVRAEALLGAVEAAVREEQAEVAGAHEVVDAHEAGHAARHLRGERAHRRGHAPCEIVREGEARRHGAAVRLPKQRRCRPRNSA
jgi:hypothetical protein